MKQNKLPASAGGIVQYSDEDVSKFSFSPKQVVFVGVLLVIIVMLLRLTNIFGF
jgi:preprotein translocase subunit Sec61beta